MVNSVGTLADLGEYSQLEQLFTKEVTVDYTSLFPGEVQNIPREQLMTQWQSVLPGFDATQHMITNHQITVDGNEAKAIAKHYSSLPQAVGTMNFFDLKLYPMQEPNWILAEYRGEIEVLSTGRPYNNRYCGLFQLRDGKIALFREYYNPLTLPKRWRIGVMQR